MKLPEQSRQMPAGAEEGIRKGLYKFETVEGKGKGHVQLLSLRCNYASRACSCTNSRE